VATDAFVALIHADPDVAIAAPDGVLPGRLKTVTATGRFRESHQTLQSDNNLWGRVVDAGTLQGEVGPEESLVGAPLTIGETVTGVVGIVVPSAAYAEADAGLRRLASVASAALERANRPA
jgi:hypothetical protein